MLTTMSLLLSVLGFAALALGMDRHGLRRLQGTRRRGALMAWRVAGTLALGASLACAVAGPGAATGTVLWVGMLSPGALVVTAVLSWRARRGVRRTGAGER